MHLICRWSTGRSYLAPKWWRKRLRGLVVAKRWNARWRCRCICYGCSAIRLLRLRWLRHRQLATHLHCCRWWLSPPRRNRRVSIAGGHLALFAFFWPLGFCHVGPTPANSLWDPVRNPRFSLKLFLGSCERRSVFTPSVLRIFRWLCTHKSSHWHRHRWDVTFSTLMVVTLYTVKQHSAAFASKTKVFWRDGKASFGCEAISLVVTVSVVALRNWHLTWCCFMQMFTQQWPHTLTEYTVQ